MLQHYVADDRVTLAGIEMIMTAGDLVVEVMMMIAVVDGESLVQEINQIAGEVSILVTN